MRSMRVGAYGDGACDNYDDLPPDRRAAIARPSRRSGDESTSISPRYLSR